MIPKGTFKVGDYDCYVSNIAFPTHATVVLADAYPVLKAECAVSTVARLLNGTDVELVRIRYSNRYACRINHVPLKELEKWQA